MAPSGTSTQRSLTAMCLPKVLVTCSIWTADIWGVVPCECCGVGLSFQDRTLQVESSSPGGVRPPGLEDSTWGLAAVELIRGRCQPMRSLVVIQKANQAAPKAKLAVTSLR